MAKTPARAGEVIPEDLMAEMLARMAPVPLSKSRAAKMKKNLLGKISASTPKRKPRPQADVKGFSTVRAASGKWAAIGPLAEARVLFDDGLSRSLLIRLLPGGLLPGHDHPGDEECLVLEGSCYLGKEFLRRGDYQMARQGTRHEEVLSPEGCLLFIRSGSTARPAAAAR